MKVFRVIGFRDVGHVGGQFRYWARVDEPDPGAGFEHGSELPKPNRAAPNHDDELARQIEKDGEHSSFKVVGTRRVPSLFGWRSDGTRRVPTTLGRNHPAAAGCSAGDSLAGASVRPSALRYSSRFLCSVLRLMPSRSRRLHLLVAALAHHLLDQLPFDAVHQELVQRRAAGRPRGVHPGADERVNQRRHVGRRVPPAAWPRESQDARRPNRSSSGVIGPPSANTISRSSVFSSSRTLPGQSCVFSASSTAGVSSGTGHLFARRSA